MSIRVNRKITKTGLFYFVILLGFLYPRGFSETVPIYQKIFSVWTWIAVILIWLQLFTHITYNIKLNIRVVVVSIYFLLSIIITKLLIGNLDEGIQQMFAYPSLCIFIVLNMKKNPEQLLSCIINMFHLLFSMNLVLFKQYFANQYHMEFLGHVQMISQFGLTAIFVCCLYWMLFHKCRFKCIYLALITAITLLTTDADSAVFTLIILLIAAIVYKWKMYGLFCLKTEWYVVGMFLLNIFIIYITAVNNIFYKIIPYIDFSGRNYVWKNAIMNISKRPLTGFGIQGILLQTFWTEWIAGGGFNYAHNQVIQNLLDGGVINLIAFWCMILAFVFGVRRIESKKYHVLINAVMLTLLFIMIFDSTTTYCYMYIILSIIFALPYILEKNYVQYNN